MFLLQFSKKFYYSGCLTSFYKSVTKQGDSPKGYAFYSDGNIQKKCVNPLEFNFPERHKLLVQSMLLNCRFRIVRKKKEYPIPDAASEPI